VTPVRPHRLTTKDTDAMTAVCEVCGPVRLASRGRGRWVCGNRQTERRQAWAARNPEKAAANRRVRSAHEVISQDRKARTGVCQKCGPVAIVPKGRGWMCATRAGELWQHQETSAQSSCRECWIIDGDRVYPVDGVCPRCSDQSLYDTAGVLRAAESRRPAHDLPTRFVVVDVEHGNPYETGEYESAIPGWRTIGSDRPWNEVL
jgi:hypothetical protein